MASRVGNLIYTAGHLPVTPEGAVISAGKVGSADVTTEQGTDAARAVALNILATLRSMAINALRLEGIWSITEGIAALAHDIKGLLRLLGWRPAAETPSG